VAFFVAKNVRSNVRELEGALRKILAYIALQPQGNFDCAGAARRSRIAEHPKPPNQRREHPKDGGRLLQDQVADMYSKSASRQHVRGPSAQIAMYLAKELHAKEPARDRRALRWT
jgi:chromosomal replication initiator protein